MSRLADWPFIIVVRDSEFKSVPAGTPDGEVRVMIADTGVAIEPEAGGEIVRS